MPRSTVLVTLAAAALVVLPLPAASGQPPRLDFGDAPDGVATGYPNGAIGRFPTLLRSDGARAQPGGFRLGRTVDLEPDAKLLGDFNDGIVLGELRSCRTATLVAQIVLSRPARRGGVTLYFNHWADWNHDGEWRGADACAPEHPVVDAPVRIPARRRSVNLNVSFPAGQDTSAFWSRSIVSAVPLRRDIPTGTFGPGEVEDGPLPVAPDDGQPPARRRRPSRFPDPGPVSCGTGVLPHGGIGVAALYISPKLLPLKRTRTNVAMPPKWSAINNFPGPGPPPLMPGPLGLLGLYAIPFMSLPADIDGPKRVVVHNVAGLVEPRSGPPVPFLCKFFVQHDAVPLIMESFVIPDPPPGRPGRGVPGQPEDDGPGTVRAPPPELFPGRPRTVSRTPSRSLLPLQTINRRIRSLLRDVEALDEIEQDDRRDPRVRRRRKAIDDEIESIAMLKVDFMVDWLPDLFLPRRVNAREFDELSFLRMYYLLKELDRHVLFRSFDFDDPVPALERARLVVRRMRMAFRNEASGVPKSVGDYLDYLEAELNRLIRAARRGRGQSDSFRRDVSLLRLRKVFLMYHFPPIYGIPWSRVFLPLEEMDLALERAQRARRAFRVGEHLERARDAKDLLLRRLRREQTFKPEPFTTTIPFPMAFTNPQPAPAPAPAPAPRAESHFGTWSAGEMERNICIYLEGPAGQTGTVSISGDPPATPASQPFGLNADGRAMVDFEAPASADFAPYEYVVERDGSGTSDGTVTVPPAAAGERGPDPPAGSEPAQCPFPG